jgi:N-carbamoylputrescine amidase|tara:strand:+ start:2807 stop:3688 length:882 start_codon:yes stop_codon:yes gene_type:complete
MKIGFIQQANQAQREMNLQHSISQIARLAAAGAELIVLPELHTSLYFCQRQQAQHFELAEALKGPTFETLAATAKQHHVVILASIFERRHSGVYHNTALVIESDGSLAGHYRKMHIPDDPGYYEKYYFTPGDTGFKPIETSVGRLGVLVCWDQWFPEAARLMALAGAEILIYPTAIGWDPTDEPAEKHRQCDAWETIQRGHAIANGLPLISVNRVGRELAAAEDESTAIDFWGNSFVCDTMGQVLLRCSQDNEQSEVIDINLTESEETRRIWPFMRDRRIDAYGALLTHGKED